MTTHPICVRIRELRTAAGLSIDQLAAALGMSSATLGSYERGDRNITVNQATRILAYFDRDIGDMPVDGSPRSVWTESEAAEALRAIAAQFDPAQRAA